MRQPVGPHRYEGEVACAEEEGRDSRSGPRLADSGRDDIERMCNAWGGPADGAARRATHDTAARAVEGLVFDGVPIGSSQGFEFDAQLVEKEGMDID